MGRWPPRQGCAGTEHRRQRRGGRRGNRGGMQKAKTPAVPLRDLPWPEQMRLLHQCRIEQAPRPVSAPSAREASRANALAMLSRAEAHYGEPVSSRQVLEHALNVEPSAQECQRFSSALKEAGAHPQASKSGKRATQLWSSKPAQPVRATPPGV